jgi:hypothetical protein
MSEEPVQRRWLSKVRAGALSYHERVIFGFLIGSAFSVFLFVGALSRFTVQYQTNDDVAMNMYAAGTGLGQQPSEFLLFQHFTVGLVLKFLYTHRPEIAWYGLLLYVYLFLSSLAIGYAILRLNPSRSVVSLWIVSLVLFYLPAIVRPQFTVCSGYLAIAGILLIYSTLHKPYRTRTNNAYYLTLGAGLLILAGIVRFHALLLALLLMTPLYVSVFVNHFPTALRRLLPILGCVLFVGISMNWAQKAYYERSPGWEQFYRYNNVLADFVDRGKVTWNESTEPLFHQIGWSRNDLEMLQNWFYLDPKVYSFPNLLFMSQNAPFLPVHGVIWGPIFSNLKQWLVSYGGLATLLLCVWLLVKGPGITQRISVLALVWYGCLFVAIAVAEKIPPLHVSLVMLLGLYIFETVACTQVSEQKAAEHSTNTKRTLWKGLLSLLVLALFTACCWGQVSVVSNVSHSHQRFQMFFQDDLARLQPRADQLFVVWGGSFPYEGLQLPTKSATRTTRMQLLGLGVGNHEPFVQNRLKSFGIDDLYQSFYTREDVFLISTNTNDLLVKYIQEHYQVTVEVTTIFRGATFRVCKVRRVS